MPPTATGRRRPGIALGLARGANDLPRRGQVLHYLIGLWIRSAALTGMQRMAEHFAETDEVFGRFARPSRRRAGAGRTAVSLRATSAAFPCRNWPARKIAIGPAGGGPAEDVLRAAGRPDNGRRIRRRGRPRRGGRRRLAAAALMAVLQGHRRPFDKLATARLMGEMVRDAVRHLEDLLRPSRFDVAARAGHLRRYLRRRAPGAAGESLAGRTVPANSETMLEQPVAAVSRAAARRLNPSPARWR